MFSVEFLTDLVQIQVRERVSGVLLARMDIPIKAWHMVEVMRRDFNEHYMTQVPITENQFGTMQLLEEVSEHVEMNYPEILGSRYVAQPVGDFLFPWEEKGSVENPNAIEEDEGFSKELQSANHQDNQRRWRQDLFCAPLKTCKILRIKLLDSSLICKYFGYCLVFRKLIFLHLVFFILKR